MINNQIDNKNNDLVLLNQPELQSFKKENNSAVTNNIVSFTATLLSKKIINYKIVSIINLLPVLVIRAISLEDLTGIRERTNQQPRKKQERRKSNSWSFYQLRQFLEYKCILAGVRLILVNPAYTSKTCHQCFHLGSRNGKRYICTNPACGWKGDADYNGAQNIAALGRFINTPGGSGNSCELSSFSDSLGLLKTPTSA